MTRSSFALACGALSAWACRRAGETIPPPPVVPPGDVGACARVHANGELTHALRIVPGTTAANSCGLDVAWFVFDVGPLPIQIDVVVRGGGGDLGAELYGASTEAGI